MSQKPIDFQTLKTQCRESALGDLPWETLLSNICQWLEADCAVMMRAACGGSYSASFSHNFDDDVLAKYTAKYNSEHPLMSASKRARTGPPLMTHHPLQHRDYVNSISRDINIMDSLQFAVLDSPITGRQVINIHRGFGKTFFDPAHLEKMQALIPHLADAYQYSIRIAGALGPQGHHDGCSLLVDSGLRAHILSGCLKHVLAGCADLSWNGEILRLNNKALSTVLSIANRNLRKGAPLNCRLKTSGSASQNGQSYIEITALTPPKIIDWLPEIKDMMMLHIVKSSGEAKPADSEIFGAIFDLTKAEIKTLNALSERGDLRCAARHLNIKYNTIRWHLKNIFLKTGYIKQDALLRAVAELDLTHAP